MYQKYPMAFQSAQIHLQSVPLPDYYLDILLEMLTEIKLTDGYRQITEKEFEIVLHHISAVSNFYLFY